MKFTIDELIDKVKASTMDDERLKELVRSTIEPDLAPLKAAHDETRDTLAKLVEGRREKAPLEEEPGEWFARYLRCFGAAKGDRDKTVALAKKHYGEDSALYKSLTTDDFDEGGSFVPEELRNDIIELLRPRSVIRSMNPLIIPMQNGVATWPKLTSGATASHVGEAAHSNATKPGTGQLRLTWKKLRAIVPVSNEWLAFSVPASNQAVREDAANALAQAQDVALIRGAGTEFTPLGLRNLAVAANVTGSNGGNDGSAPTLAEVEQDLAELIQALEAADVRMLRPGILMSPRSKNYLIRLRDGNGNLAFPDMRGQSPTLWTMPVGVSNNIPSDLGAGTDPESELYLVDFADFVVGEATQMEVSISNEASYHDDGGTLVSAYDRDETVLKIIERYDCGMRHDESVAVKTGVVYGAN